VSKRQKETHHCPESYTHTHTHTHTKREKGRERERERVYENDMHVCVYCSEGGKYQISNRCKDPTALRHPTMLSLAHSGNT